MICRGQAFWGSLLGIACSVGALAQVGGYTALNLLEPGEWALVEHGHSDKVRHVCVGDPVQLLQPHHPDRQCKQFLLENAARRVAITYDCAQAGRGRTTLRVETGRLVQIESQGVAGGAPFAMAIEGRRVGVCRGALPRR